MRQSISHSKLLLQQTGQVFSTLSLPQQTNTKDSCSIQWNCVITDYDAKSSQCIQYNFKLQYWSSSNSRIIFRLRKEQSTCLVHPNHPKAAYTNTIYLLDICNAVWAIAYGINTNTISLLRFYGCGTDLSLSHTSIYQNNNSSFLAEIPEKAALSISLQWS